MDIKTINRTKNPAIAGVERAGSAWKLCILKLRIKKDFHEALRAWEKSIGEKLATMVSSTDFIKLC